MTTTNTELRTWTMHASLMPDNQGHFYTNFGASIQFVAFNTPSRDARTVTIRLVEDANGEYLGMIKDGELDPRSIRRFSLTDPWSGTPSERAAMFDFDGTPVRLRITKY